MGIPFIRKEHSEIKFTCPGNLKITITIHFAVVYFHYKIKFKGGVKNNEWLCSLALDYLICNFCIRTD